ncbi:hypothetical protein ACTFIU_001685 [Dictyostelium citrinum]
MFCSSDCLVKSKLYAATLDETAVYLRNVESKKILPTEQTLISSQSQSQTKTQTQAQQPPKPTSQPIEFLNKFEKSLVITENENASLIPPNLNFDKNVDNETTKIVPQPSTKTSPSIVTKIQEKPTTKTTTPTIKKKTIIKPKKKTIIRDDLKVPIEKKEIKIKDSDDEDDSDLDYYSEDDEDDTLLGDEQDDAPMLLNEDEDEDKEEEDYNEVGEDDDENKSDKSEDEFSLFRPTQMSGKRIEELFKPHISNYHMVYSALSQFTTKHTNNFLQFNQVNYEYILEQNLQIKTNLHSQLSLVYQSVIDELCFKITTAKEKVTMLIDTFKFDKPVPSLRRNHWKMLILVFLKCLSSIDDEILKDIKDNNDKFENLVKECNFDMETLKVFQDLLIQGYQ